MRRVWFGLGVLTQIAALAAMGLLALLGGLLLTHLAPFRYMEF